MSVNIYFFQEKNVNMTWHIPKYFRMYLVKVGTLLYMITASYTQEIYDILYLDYIQILLIIYLNLFVFLVYLTSNCDILIYVHIAKWVWYS